MICACLQHTHLLSIQLFSFYFLLIRGANSATSASVCMSVRMSACLSASISQKPDVRTLAVHAQYGSGSDPHLAALRYAIYFRFMDGIMCHVCTGIGGTKKACAPSNLPGGQHGFDAATKSAYILSGSSWTATTKGGEICYRRLPCSGICFQLMPKSHLIERQSLFTKYITQIIHINCYNGRLPVEALAHRSWPPITKKQYTHTDRKKCKKNKKTCKSK